MLRSLCNSIYRIKSKEGSWIQQLKLCSTVAKEDIENNSANMDRFLEKETEILNVINKSNVTELNKHIKLSYAKMIVSCRINNGLYESLNDILVKNEIESDVLNKFYDSIIKYKRKPRRKLKVTPDIKKIQVPNTTLGIHVGPSLVTWATITNNFKVLQWDSIPWYDDNPQECSYNIIKLIGPIMSKLPSCDSYVTEESLLNNVTSKNMVYCQRQLTIAIMGCLKLLEAQRTGDSSTEVNRIFVLHPCASAYFHNLIVGSEIISPNYILEKILNNDTQANNNEVPNVDINNRLKNNYLTANKFKQEEMSWSLLKALTFIQLFHSSELR